MTDPVGIANIIVGFWKTKTDGQDGFALQIRHDFKHTNLVILAESQPPNQYFDYIILLACFQ